MGDAFVRSASQIRNPAIRSRTPTHKHHTEFNPPKPKPVVANRTPTPTLHLPLQGPTPTPTGPYTYPYPCLSCRMRRKSTPIRVMVALG